MIKQFLGLLIALTNNKQLLFTLVKNDLRTKYLNNFLGILWAFIQPVATVLILWFVFEVGFRARPVNDVPFILWLITGLIPWFYFSESMSSTCGAVKENSFLVKKIVFKVSLLPIVKQTSALIIHLFFVSFMLLILVLYGYSPSWQWLQLVYYILCASIFLVGLAWLTSSVVIFFNDLSQLIAMATQFGFWLTPIFWQIDLVPEGLRWLFMLNPVYYIVNGFRETLIQPLWFWEKPLEAAVFWGITLTMLVTGATVFKRLRPHFSDVI